MKNKGFTLIEVLAVIVLLTAIMLIVVPKVVDIIKENSQKLYDNQMNTIIKQADTYVNDNNDTLSIGSDLCITLDQLHNGGYIKNKELTDPRDNTILSGAIKAIWDTEHNRYNYSYTTSITCE